MPLRTRRLFAAIVAILVATGATFALLRQRDAAAPRGQARVTAAAKQTSGSAGMPGMTATSGSGIELTADELRTFGVTFGTAEMRVLRSSVRTVGTVQVDETRTAQVVPKIAGYLERLYVNFVGQPVRRGQPMVEIFSPDLVAAQQELLLAARLKNGMGEQRIPGVPGGNTDLLEAARARLRLWDISEPQIDEVLKTGKVRRTLTLYAPVSGIVTEKHVLQGQAVQAGAALFTIADLSRVWVNAQLREADAGDVRQGSMATIELAAFPGRPMQGRVDFVYPTLDPQTRTLTARISMPNPGERIKPGMYATVQLGAPIRSALTVPVSALLRTGARTLTFVDLGRGRIAPQEVETGLVSGDYAEILSGLLVGQRVVTSAQFLLDSESNLGEVMKRMVGQVGAQDVGKTSDMSDMKAAPADKGADMRGMPGMNSPQKQ